MTLAASGTISIGGSTSTRSINLELGRSATATSSLGETSLRTLAGVASGAISLSNFYGKSALEAAMPQYNNGVYDVMLSRECINTLPNATQASATVEIILSSDGSGAYRYSDYFTGTTNFTTFTWKTGGGSAGDYFAHWVSGTGTVSGSSMNTSLALSTSRTFSVTAAVSQANWQESAYAQGTLQIRNAGGTVLASRTAELSAYAQTGDAF